MDLHSSMIILLLGFLYKTVIYRPMFRHGTSSDVAGEWSKVVEFYTGICVCQLILRFEGPHRIFPKQIQMLFHNIISCFHEFFSHGLLGTVIQRLWVGIQRMHQLNSAGQLQNVATSLLEFWNPMDAAMKEHGKLSAEIINYVKDEISRPGR